MNQEHLVELIRTHADNQFRLGSLAQFGTDAMWEEAKTDALASFSAVIDYLYPDTSTKEQP